MRGGSIARHGSWALVLGASSGMGAACARRLARDGFEVCGVHLDRRATQPQADAVRASIEALGRKAVFVNRDASSEETRAEVVRSLQEETRGAPRVAVLVHSIASGAPRPLLPLEGAGDDAAAAPASPGEVRATVEAMGNDVVYWTQALVAAGLLARPARVLAMTSEGALRALPRCGALSAAKAALEAHLRQLSLELAPRGATANAVLAGVADTPAARRIPGWEAHLEGARRRNPHGRLTTPEDVAAAVSLLCDERAGWISGGVVRVDGGETAAG